MNVAQPLSVSPPSANHRGHTVQGYPITIGRYEILRPIAEGGFGQVFLARMDGAAGFQRIVAIKRIRREHTSSADFVRDFIKEARIGGMLQHHHVVQVMGFEEFEGNYLLVMEFVDGVGLDGIINIARSSHSTLPLGVVAEICAQAAEGLEYIHKLHSPEGEHLGLVHRDIKPSNMLIARSGLLKITDFGIVRAATEQGKQTTAGIIKGTLNYLSPEQARGEPLDLRSDLYSMGAILYELLTLRTLWQADQPWVMIGRLGNNDVGEALDQLPEPAAEFLPVLRGLLTSSPADRFPSAAALADQLRQLQLDYGRPGVNLARLAGVWADEYAIRRGDFDVASAPTRNADSDPFFPRPSAFNPESLSPTSGEQDPQAPTLRVEEMSADQAADTLAGGVEKTLPSLPRKNSKVERLAEEATHASSRTLEPLIQPKGRDQRSVLLAAGVAGLALVAALLYSSQNREVTLGDPNEAPGGAASETLPGSSGQSASPGQAAQNGAPQPAVEAPPPQLATSDQPATLAADQPGLSQAAGVEGGTRGGSTAQLSPGTSPSGANPSAQATVAGSSAQSGTTTLPETGTTGTRPASGSSQTRITAPAQSAPARVSAKPALSEQPAPEPALAKGKLTVTSRPAAQVFLDGKAIGETPLRGKALDAQSYELRLSRPDLNFVQSVTVKLQPGKEALVVCMENGCDVTFR